MNSDRHLNIRDMAVQVNLDVETVKCPEFCATIGFSAMTTLQSIIGMEHPPFSPDLAPNKFWLFL
jgi:hypothetical protein